MLNASACSRSPIFAPANPRSQTTPAEATLPPHRQRHSSIGDGFFRSEALRLADLQPQDLPQLQKMPLNVALDPEGNTILKRPLLNGSSAYLQQDAELHSSSVQVLLPINPDKSEASLLGGLLTDSSKLTQQFRLDLSTQGIDVVATVGDQHLGLLASGPAGKEADMIQALSVLLLTPQVDEVIFNQNKSLTLKNMLNLYNATGTVADELLEQSLYGTQHPHIKTSQHMIADVQQQTAPQALEALQQGLPLGKNIRWVMVSPLAVAEQEALLNQALPPEAWQLEGDEQVAEAFHTHLAPASPISKPTQPLLVVDNSLQRLQVKRIWQAPPYGQDQQLAFSVLERLLKGMNGSLFSTLRTQEGLVYSVQSSYSKNPVMGELRVVTDVDVDKYPRLTDALNRAIQSVCNAPPSQEELDRVIRGMVYNLREAKGHSEEQVNLISSRLDAELTPSSIDERIASLLRITPADVQAVAKQFLSPEAWSVTVVTGPSKGMEELFPNQPKLGRQVAKDIETAQASPELDIQRWLKQA